MLAGVAGAADGDLVASGACGVGDAGVVVGPRDEERLVAETLRVLGDAALRRRLSEAGVRRSALFDEATYVRGVLEALAP